MKGTRWTRVPWVSLSCLSLCLLPHVVPGTTGETSTTESKNPTAVTSAGSVAMTLEGQSTATSSRTSNQDISASSQNHQTKSTDTTSEAQTSTLTQMMTSTLSSSSSVLNGMETVSQKTSPPDEMSTSFLSSVTNTFMMTSKTIAMTTSTDSTLGNIEETSTPGTESSTPVTSAVSITAESGGQSQTTSSRTSIQDTSASSQNHQTQSTETTKESQTSTLTQRTTSIPSFSPSVHNVKGTISQKTSPPGETTTSSLSSVTNTPMMTSKKITMTTSTDSTLGNTGETSVPVTRSLMPVTSAASITAEPEGQLPATSSRTSTQDITGFSQNHQSQSTKTTRVSQINTLTPVTTSTVLYSPSGFNPSGTVSQETFPSGETTTSSPSSVSNAFLVTSEVFRMPTSRDSTLGNTEEISLPVRGTISAITSRVSTIWLSDTLSTALSPRSLPPKISTAFHTQQSEGAETTGWPHERSSVSPGVSHETFTPHETTTWPSSFSSEDRTTWSPKELPSTPTGAATRLVTGSPFTGTAGTIPRVPSEVSTIGESGQPTTHPSCSTTLPETTGAGAQTQWTQETGTTGEVLINSPSYSVTQMINTATSPSSSPMLDGHTSQQITMAPSTNHSTIHSTNTSPQESLAVSQRGHTQAPQTTQESQTTRSISPVTDTKTVTTPGSSFTASGHSPSEIAPQDAPTISAATTFAPAPTGDGHTTQAPTTALQAAPSSPDSTLEPSGGASLSITGALPGVVSTPGAPEGRWTSASASTSPDTAAAMTQTHQTEGTEASGETQTSEPASSGSGTASEGTATPSSSRASGTTPSGSEGISTSGETTWFSPNPSRDSHTTQSSTELLSASASHDATPVSMGMVSAIVPSTFPVTLSEASTAGRPTGQSSPTSPSTSPQETAAISRMAQTQRTGTNRGSDTISLVSQATDTFSTVTPTPPSITSSGLTSPQTETHTLSPSGSSTTFIMALVSNTAPGPAVTLNSTTLLTGHATPLAVTSASSASTVSSGSPLKTETSGMTTPSVKTDGGRGRVTSLPPTTSQTTTAPSPPPTTSQAATSATPSTATHTRSTAAPVPVPPEKGASLLPFGAGAGDLELVRSAADFTSPLLRPAAGFPLGSSLRDALYFTDNGQIIFPESDYQIFSYPNPLPTGFTGWDPVALVAPFWDDADFSTGQGTIFYQEYETLYGEHSLPVLQAESWIRKITNNGGFKARWTLKVTWVNAHAYPAQWTLGSNTYQAILSTDGSRSYALFLYQSGGMQWDVAQRSGNLVLMGFSSGDGYFENSPLMSQPVWEKYRPDRFLNSSSGLRGLQFYRLHREERPNYRLKCLQWLKSQPRWPSWGWNQASCPCSWQQGRWDLRFQPVSIGLWGLSSRQLCSFTSWRGGVCCSYGPWGEFREGWHVQRPWQFAQELEPQSWCCLWNDKPYLCALYQQRRPRVGCATYRPPRPAWMFGDPHITTLDGVNYTFNGLGDFLLIRAQDRNSSFLLQGRTAQTGSAQATNFIAFAAQYRSSSLGPVTVQWLLEPHDGIHVLLDNQTVTFEPGHEDGGGQGTFNATGVLLSRHGSVVSASFDGCAAVSVTALSNILHASASLPPEYQNRTEGLLGVWNNNPEDDFRMPNGSTIPPGSSEEMLFHYGMTWQINGTGFLGKRNDQLPSNFTPVFYSQLQKNSSWAEDLISNCHGDSSCIYDTLALRNASIGFHTRAISKTYKQVNATLNQYPPSINGGRVVEAYKGQTTLIQYTSNAEDATFTLGDNCTDFKLFENGTLLWTPKSLEPFTLEILARSAKIGLASALQPRTVVCHCNAESQCLYNQTSRVGNSSLEVAGCKCDGGTFGRYCERSKDACEEPCFPSVRCIPGKGCEACPPHLTGDGRHCAAPGSPFLCRNQSCPVNYCYNQGHCYISQTLGCQPTCTCPPAFTDSLCFLAGNNFSPTVHLEPPLRVIQLLLSEEENASMAEVNASVAYILGTLDMRAFLRNSQVNRINSPAPASGSPIQHWMVISEFQYRPWGPVINFLNNQLLAAVVEAFLYQVPRRSEESRNHVVFQPISREDVWDVTALNVSTLKAYFKCSGYKGYELDYSPQSGFTCVSPCSRGYCDHGGQCQHLPSGPRCSCVSFSIYTAWGERCEHLSMKLDAFFGIFFGSLGGLLLLGVGMFVVLRFWDCSRTRFSYLLHSAEASP
ncbi:mucin-4 [Trachypithecus francoisi]|uniref:mucin-4 n=1 Tax=Trachypithecus francoisi TaxID=54180 RepID=UPI00141A737A|nr:mucin-4 [Trachypithecus francoisi]